MTGKKAKVVRPTAPATVKIQLRTQDADPTLPFQEALLDRYTRLHDSIPLVHVLEKSAVWKARKFAVEAPHSVQYEEEPSRAVCLQVGDRTVTAFQKTIHLLDSYKMLRYGLKYPQESLDRLWTQFDEPSLVDANNQAYVDICASYIAGQLGEATQSPHFAKFYGSFRAMAKVHRIHLSEDIADYRYSKWFWEAYDKGYFTLEIRDADTQTLLDTEEVLQTLRPDASLCEDTESQADTTVEELSTVPDNEVTDEALGELQEMGEDDIPPELEAETKSIHRHGSRGSTASGTSTETDVSDMYIIHALVKDVPVAIVWLEKLDHIMDDLLEAEDFDDGWETRWSAWLFQVTVALQQLQSGFSCIHNDLHTNNVMWIPTEQTHFVYRDSKGTTWNVPTYGKRFVLIDFGRATFTWNGVEVISSDFQEGHDGAGQYNYGSLRDWSQPQVRPNPSFDLARLSCSLLRGLFPRNPAPKPKGSVLSSENGWIVRETPSDLFNMLWSWLVDDEHANILEDEEGDEKFPGFDLYQHIAEHCKKAKPMDWIYAGPFRHFMIQTPIPAGTPVVPGLI